MQHLQKALDSTVGIARAVGGEAAPHFSHPCECASELWRHTWERYRGGSCTEGNLLGTWAQQGWSPWASHHMVTPASSPDWILAGLKSPLQPEPFHSLTQALLLRFLPSWAGLLTNCSLTGLSISFTEEMKPRAYVRLPCKFCTEIYVFAMSQRGTAPISWPCLGHHWHYPAGHSVFLKCRDTHCAKLVMCKQAKPHELHMVHCILLWK